MRFKYRIIDYFFGEDIGDLIYSIENKDFKDSRKILKFLENKK
jgi:hypothetical protein